MRPDLFDIGANLLERLQGFFFFLSGNVHGVMRVDEARPD
jgi:hypothetical protein